MTTTTIRSLYSSLLRTSRSFQSYNFREYFVARTKQRFRDIQNEKDPAKIAAFCEDAATELEVLRRSVVMNKLYGSSKLAVEKSDVKL